MRAFHRSRVERLALVFGLFLGARDGLFFGQFALGELAFGHGHLARAVFRKVDFAVVDLDANLLAGVVGEIHPAAHHLADFDDLALHLNGLADIVVRMGEQGGERHGFLHRERFAQLDLSGGEQAKGQNGSKKEFAFPPFYCFRGAGFAAFAQFRNFSPAPRNPLIEAQNLRRMRERQGGINERESTHSRIGCSRQSVGATAGRTARPRAHGIRRAGRPRTRRTGLVATVTGAPYSAVEVRTSQQVLAAGNAIQRTEQTNVYRDSQGRVRRETTRTGPDGQTHTQRDHLRSGGGHRYRIGREE